MDWLVKSKPKAQYQGNYKFHLVLNQDTVDSSSTISITAFTDSSQRAVVPCNYIWFIIKNGVPQEIPQFRGSSFICQTAHIGYLLQAHIVSNDSQYPGKAIVTLGPVQLDVSLKTDILAALSQGYSNQPVYLIGPEQQQRQCTIQIYEDKIRIMHAFSDLSYTFDYSLLEPLFTHNPKDISHLSILFNEKYEQEFKKFQRRIFGREEYSMTRSTIKNNSSSSQKQLKLDLRFLSRANRDVFLFTMKGFITKRQLKNSVVIHKIEKINFDNKEQFNAILLVNQLRKDLVRYDRAYKKLAEQRKKIEDGWSPPSIKSLPRRQEPPLAGKVMQLQRLNEMLNNRIRSLMQEVSQIKLTSTPPPPQTIGFKKKRQAEENTFTYLLDDLNRSQQMVHFDAENNFAMQRLKSQNKVLQMNLEQANQKILFLEKRANTLPPGAVSIQKQTLDRLRTQNDDLKRANDKIDKQLRQSKEAIHQLKNQNIKKSQAVSNDGFLQREIEDLRSRLAICEHELDDMTKSKQVFEDKCGNLSRKVSEMEHQIDMYRRNQDVMNRSQSLCEQMDDYNEEQIRILKEHNGFLVNENEKLAKACQKYMAEAKQAIKLRQEILQLREKLNKAYTNPENQSFET